MNSKGTSLHHHKVSHEYILVHVPKKCHAVQQNDIVKPFLHISLYTFYLVSLLRHLVKGLKWMKAPLQRA